MDDDTLPLLYELESRFYAIPLEFFMAIAFICCALCVLVLLVQAFIPCVRRFYVRLSRSSLELLHVRAERLAPLASLLDSYTAWMHFTWGLCLLPLCFGFYADAFHSSTGGPFNIGFTPLMIFFSGLLMLVTFFFGTLWLLIRWVGICHSKEHTPTLPPAP